jgi:gliding motility-associated lipoprotein GldH
LLAHIKTPDGRIVTKRVNFTLTDEAGKPLGRSTGGTVNYELPLMMNRKMESAGTYTIALEQNMRDSVIFGIESIGVKIKQGEPVF